MVLQLSPSAEQERGVSIMECIIATGATGEARDEMSALVIPVTARPCIQGAVCLLEIYFLQIVLF